MNDLQAAILLAADGKTRSADIAQRFGCSAKYVQNVIRRYGGKALPRGARPGADNPAYLGGRRIDRDGYAVVSAPPDHPYARRRPGRSYGLILEHRAVMERHLGRYLLPSEIVDHIDGLHLHNSPANLRLFASNADHLRATITGQTPKWSAAGWARMTLSPDRRADVPPVDTYRQRKARGDVRLLQILLLAYRLGTASPFLLGTHRHLAKAGIVDLSHPTIERELHHRFPEWASAHTQ